MQMRPLGRTGLSIAPLVFGGNVFGWTADKATSFDLLDRFVDAGFNAIDTADVYSRWAPGHSGGEWESVIGEWMKARKARDRVVVITKVGSDMGSGRRDLSKTYILKAVEDSLRRLQTDVIDLYLSHWPDPQTPYEETLSAYEDLVKAGKVRSVGCSNLDATQLRAALDVAKDKGLPRYEVLQPELNLYRPTSRSVGFDDRANHRAIGPALDERTVTCNPV
jgi:aryl-alcohol dehydrogenase-like predicted oxidoreductase